MMLTTKGYLINTFFTSNLLYAQVKVLLTQESKKHSAVLPNAQV